MMTNSSVKKTKTRKGQMASSINLTDEDRNLNSNFKFRCSQAWKDKIDEIAQEAGYSNKSEFAREVLTLAAKAVDREISLRWPRGSVSIDIQIKI